LSYTNGDKSINLQPLKGQIDTEKSSFFVGKVKIEISLVKLVHGRWGGLIGDAPDRKLPPPPPFKHAHIFRTISQPPVLAQSSYQPSPSNPPSTSRSKHKNWEGISDEILKSDKERTTDEDPNVGGDSTLNSFFQKIYADADEDTRRAMMKSFSESGGTTLSTNWDEVKKKSTEVKPPSGSEWKKWN
jgi:suppressor of G2 allele of SKP1